MEEQKADACVQSNEPEPEPLTFAASPQLASTTTLASSEPSLRFPRPQVNRQLASWISSSHPDIMTPTDPSVKTDNAALAESTYEFINTDDEGQDGQDGPAESLDSYEYTQADDVHSLAGTEQSSEGLDTDSESDEEDEQPRVFQHDEEAEKKSHAYAEESLKSPSSSCDMTPDDDFRHNPLASKYINFTESHTDDHDVVDKIEVKHTIREFTNDEVAILAQNMRLPKVPERLTATIRQTMDQSCLAMSAQKPLHILYVGNTGPRHRIIRRISTALSAHSPDLVRPVGGGNGVSSMVPHTTTTDNASAFCAESTNVFPANTRVETCTHAEETVYISDSLPGEAIFTMTLDDNHTYNSAHPAGGPVIEPAYALPHIAVFYLTERDSKAALRTRDAAWEFMNRHSVPCIFISNAPAIEESAAPWAKFINPDAIHLCLESSDPADLKMRMPINVASFLTIDPRQMNRNLAYLTGLADRPKSQQAFYNRTMALGKKSFKRVASVYRQARILMDFVVTIFVGLSLFYSFDGYLHSNPGGVTIPGTSVPSVADLTHMVPDATTIINLTSSTAVEIPRVLATPSNVALMPFSNLFPDMLSDSKKEGTICSLEISGQREILVKIPIGTKTTWLGKDSITIDVLRDGKVVKTKFSSVDEGLLLEIPKRDAYGVVSVTIVTNRKPKVNETLEVDFGKGILTDAIDLGKHLIVDLADTAAEAAGSLKEQTAVKLREVSDYGAVASDGLKHALADKWNEVQHDVTETIHKTADLPDKLDLSIVTAQIQSRLWWLRVQGKTEEHAEYEKKARKFIAKKRDEAHKASQLRHKSRQGTDECQAGASRWSKRCGN
ncbi:hypothetical protein ACHAQA_009987 [Verticillium albo-atrum]